MAQSLYLLRHAKAQPWRPGKDDFSRGLSQSGLEHMQRLAAWARDALVAPESVLCSTSQRTRETLTPFFAVWPQLADRTDYAGEIYEATAGTLHALLETAFERASTVLMVGHNPGFEHLAALILAATDVKVIGKISTGSLAVIDFFGGYELDWGKGKLRLQINRRQLEL